MERLLLTAWLVWLMLTGIPTGNVSASMIGEVEIALGTQERVVLHVLVAARIRMSA